MTGLEREIQEVELAIEEANAAVKKASQLRKLMKNAEFRAIIEEDYLREEAIRLAHIFGSPSPTLKAAKDDIAIDIQGIGSLKRYFHTILMMGSQAEDAIIAHQENLDELRQSEVDAEDLN